ncbi:MAG: M23 family metallopeptidase [Myxococcales bacterium]|nr:M23 family metallopeptidase [Myxococcales bacterium]
MPPSHSPPKTSGFRAWLVAAAALLVLASGGYGRAHTGRTPPRAPEASEGAPEASPCPQGTLPDEGACVRAEALDTSEGAEKEAAPNGHHDRSGRWAIYEQIPKLPERPAAYEAYRYPVQPGLPGGKYVVSGYDLDQPDERQRRGRTLSHVGHGGLDLPQTKGAPVVLVALEHQQGDAEVLFTGRLFGTTVITRHTVREGGRTREYLVLFGHLDSIAPSVSPGVRLPEGAPVGGVGDTGSPQLVHLHLEVRRVREGVDLTKIAGGGALIAESVSVVCDPRNVLPLQ